MDEFQKKKSFFKRPLFYILLAAIVFTGAAISIYAASKAGKSPYELTEVKRGQIIQEVSVTGRVKPAESVDLAFERSGKVQSIGANVGDKVSAGQTLITLNNSDLAAQVAQAQANLQREQANLDQIRSGARPEDLQIAQTAVANAQKSLADAETSLTNTKNSAELALSNLYDKIGDILSDAYVKADDAVNKQLDGIYINPDSTNPQLTFYTTSQATADATWKRQTAGSSLRNLRNSINALPLDNVGRDAALIAADNDLTVILDFLNSLSDALAGASGISPATLSGYKSNVNLARANVNAALTAIKTQKQSIASQKAANQSNINTAQTAVNTAKSSLASAQDNLALKQAGSTAEQIKAQEAQVRYASANLQSAQAQLEKTIIRSPIAGIVTKQAAKVGEIITANTPIVSIISDAQFEIEANIPEADIAKIKIGQSAKVTLDTYGNEEIFAATVTSVDPGESIVEGVATYKTKLQFNQNDDRVKSGMTANLDILTNKKENALYIPQRALLQLNNEKFVLTPGAGNITEEKEVETGLKGTDGNLEIIGGLNEGEMIIATPSLK